MPASTFPSLSVLVCGMGPGPGLVSWSPACELFRNPMPVRLSSQVGGGRD